MRDIFVTGINTDVGKTITSAILANLLSREYFKPISCGPNRDRRRIQSLLCAKNMICHPESYHFPAAKSPHEAAKIAGIDADPAKVVRPASQMPLIIEGAGGALVPFNDYSLAIDIFKEWNCLWVVVVSAYLGSINHTLLTIEALQARGLEILGLVFCKEHHHETKQFLENYLKLPSLGEIAWEERWDLATIERYGKLWQNNHLWKRFLP